MVLPLAASILWLAPISRNINGLVGDWNGLVSYGALLLYGAFIFGSSDLLRALQRQRLLSLAIGIAAYAVLYVGFFGGTVRPIISPEARPVFALLSAVNTMAWLFAIIGFAHRYLTRRPAFLAEATEAVYPFYLLHQTVTVIAVYWLLTARRAAGRRIHRWRSLATFVGTWLIYAGLVRPWRWIRPLFGMKAACRGRGGGPCPPRGRPINIRRAAAKEDFMTRTSSSRARRARPSARSTAHSAPSRPTISARPRSRARSSAPR